MSTSLQQYMCGLHPMIMLAHECVLYHSYFHGQLHSSRVLHSRILVSGRWTAAFNTSSSASQSSQCTKSRHCFQQRLIGLRSSLRQLTTHPNCRWRPHLLGSTCGIPIYRQRAGEPGHANIMEPGRSVFWPASDKKGSGSMLLLILQGRTRRVSGDATSR
jgi:hypothetical protein